MRALDDARPQPSSLHMRLALVLTSLALAGMAYTHILDAQMKAQEHVWYMFGLFCCNIAASLAMMAALVIRPSSARLWAAAGGLAAVTIGCYVWSRTIGFPQMADHIGDWASTPGIASLVCEAAVAAVGLAMFERLRPSAARVGTAVTIGAVVLLAAPIAAAGAMQMTGPMTEYPNLTVASTKDRHTTGAIVRHTWRHIGRFDTLAKAERLGYRFSKNVPRQLRWPAVRHMRKHGVGWWGKLLDASAPQALMWWCAQERQCTLIGVMYRAPAMSMPPTYGGLLLWHKHGPTGTWMTHIWFTHDLRTALARCVPFAQLQMSRGVQEVPYMADIEQDLPCKASSAPMRGGM